MINEYSVFPTNLANLHTEEKLIKYNVIININIVT